jgi:hypothetical protein
MKISPVASVQNMVTVAPGTPAQAEAPRSIRMTTNATPLRAVPDTETPAAVQNLGIRDPNDPAQRQPEVTEPLSPQAAALARQRRSLQVKERELKAREEALKTQPAAQAGGIDLARLKAEPLSVLQEAGITYDQLSQAILSQAQGVSPEQFRALQIELQTIKDGLKKEFTDRDQQGRQEALRAMTSEAQSAVAQGDEFELVRETRSVPDAIRLIERIYDQTGEVKDVRWALAEIESELVKDILKVAGLPKVQGQMQPRAAAPAQAPQSRPPMRTLSNRDTASAPMSPKQRALAAFWGQPTR